MVLGFTLRTLFYYFLIVLPGIFLSSISTSAKNTNPIRVLDRLPIELIEVVSCDPNDNIRFSPLIPYRTSPLITTSSFQSISRKFDEHAIYRIIIRNLIDSNVQYHIRFKANYANFIIHHRMDGNWIQIPCLEKNTFPDAEIKSRLFSEHLFNLGAGSVDTLFLQPTVSESPGLHWRGVDLVHPKRFLYSKSMHLWGGVVEQFFIPGFLILLLFQITYIFVQYYFHGYKEYSYYLGYIFCLMLYFLLRLESVIRFFDLFSISVINIKHMRNVLLLAPFIYYFKFSRHFLRMPEFYPNKNRQIKIIEDAVIVSIGGYILLMFLRIDQLMMYVLLVTLILFLLVIRYFIYFIRQKNNLTYFLLFGSLFAATGHIIAMIFSAYTNSANFFLFPPILATLIGLGLEILMFNLGLAAKAKADHENIKQSQQDLIEQYRQNEELRKSFHENRDRIARDLHDEIGSSLSSIRIYSTLALQRLNENPEEAKSLISQINNNTGDVMEHMNDIVWSINPKNDTLEKIMERIKNYATEVLSSQNIQFGIHYDHSLNDQQIPMETRQHLFLILKEAINNQAKHSNATRVTIELLLADNEMILKISDNGTGFDTTKTSKGNGLHNISSRVWDCGGSVDIVSDHQKGTQINIRIPLPNIRD